jgi:hypothetical protein
MNRIVKRHLESWKAHGSILFIAVCSHCARMNELEGGSIA